MATTDTMDDLVCQNPLRRAQVMAAGFNGVDYVEVVDGTDSTVLCVHFFGRIPVTIQPDNIRIEGGRRIRNIKVVGVEVNKATDTEIDDCLRVRVDRAGDFSTYRFCLVDAEGTPPLEKIDPRYRCVDFVFHVDCVPCPTPTTCPPADPGPQPEINYLAKDYQSFRQLVLDRLAVLVPDWKERHAADLGVALVEVLAYVGDSLSYFQDSVATEAYLETARQRISVRRHARLVDYDMHEGVNARAFVVLSSDNDVSLGVDDLFFTTAFENGDGCGASGKILKPEDLPKPPAATFETFEPVVPTGQTSIDVVADHSEIQIYTWGDAECCLPKGSTRATLVDRVKGEGDGATRALRLAPGDLLLLEEVTSPTTGNPADADPSHRQVVRLVSVTPDVDPLFQQPVVEVTWDPADALTFPLCASSSTGAPECRTLTRLSVARGNVILVDHGATVVPDEPLGQVPVASTDGECRCEGALVEVTEHPGPFRPVLARKPVVFDEAAPAAGTPGSSMLIQDPRKALPAVTLTEALADEGAAGATVMWTPRGHLLDSGPVEANFVVEIDNDGAAHLRFGDGDLGREPGARSTFTARYRVGGGPAGNVGAETITEIVLRHTTITGVLLTARNPLPAVGGVAPESADEVKQLAPGAFRRVLRRAVTADDYAALAEAPDGVPSTAIQDAAATLAWTGSWYEADVAVDPFGGEVASPDLLHGVELALAPFRRIRHDVRAIQAGYVPLDLVITICVRPHHVQRDVIAAVVDVLSSQRRADGSLGFFHPDNLRFGQPVFLSRIVGVVQAVPGVSSVVVNRLRRLFDPPQTPPPTDPSADVSGVPDTGVLPIGFLEIAQLDNDPNEPENGRLTILAQGGR